MAKSGAGSLVKLGPAPDLATRHLFGERTVLRFPYLTFFSDEVNNRPDEPRAPDRGPFMKAQSDVGSLLVSSLAKIPGVVVKRKLTSANFTVRKKVFAFTSRDGVVLKLPPETVKRLLEAGTASRLVMGKRTMKEWIVIRLKNPSDAKKQLRLFKEAMAFVSAKA